MRGFSNTDDGRMQCMKRKGMNNNYIMILCCTPIRVVLKHAGYLVTIAGLLAVKGQTSISLRNISDINIAARDVPLFHRVQALLKLHTWPD